MSHDSPPFALLPDSSFAFFYSVFFQKTESQKELAKMTKTNPKRGNEGTLYPNKTRAWFFNSPTQYSFPNNCRNLRLALEFTNHQATSTVSSSNLLPPHIILMSQPARLTPIAFDVCRQL